MVKLNKIVDWVSGSHCVSKLTVSLPRNSFPSLTLNQGYTKGRIYSAKIILVHPKCNSNIIFFSLDSCKVIPLPTIAVLIAVALFCAYKWYWYWFLLLPLRWEKINREKTNFEFWVHKYNFFLLYHWEEGWFHSNGGIYKCIRGRIYLEKDFSRIKAMIKGTGFLFNNFGGFLMTWIDWFNLIKS